MDVPQHVAQDLSDALFDMVHELGDKPDRGHGDSYTTRELYPKLFKKAQRALLQYADWLKKQ